MKLIDWLDGHSGFITAMATISIACLTKRLIDENKLLREETKDEPSLVVVKTGNDSGKIRVTNLSKHHVALHAIILAENVKERDVIHFLKESGGNFTDPVILPSASVLQFSYEKVRDWSQRTVIDKKDIWILPPPFVEAEASKPSSLYSKIQGLGLSSSSKIKQVFVVFFYGKYKKPYLLKVDFKDPDASLFSDSEQKLIDIEKTSY
ncbi:hypothetical protein [Desulfurobacterium atlanticum]|nr:hypothetical protein [Desulfurobacterium atlanticum]